MATHSSTLAWKISWTEEPGRLQSMGSQRVGHDWVTSLSGSSLLCWFSLVVGSRGCLFSSCDAGFSLCWLLLLWSTGPMVMAHGLNCSTACEIFLNQGQTCVSCIGSWILYHWAAGKLWLNHNKFYEVSGGFTFVYVLVAQTVKNPPAMKETWLRSLGWEDPLEEGMATYSNILAWESPWTEEPGGL